MSLALQPSGSWIRLDVLAGSPDLVWQVAARPWPDPSSYYGGYKPQAVTTFGDVVRALSDPTGAPIVGRFSFDVFDKSGAWRDLLADRVYLSSQDVTYFLASARAHDLAVLADPRVAFRGQILRGSPKPNRKFTVEAESRIGTKYGPFNLDSPVLRRAFTATDFPNLPRDKAGTAVPFLWGELSDEGTISAPPDPNNSTVVNDVAGGMAVPTFCGFLPGASPVYGLSPTNLVIDVYGSGPRKHIKAAVTFRIIGGGETLPTIIDVPSYPARPGPPPDPYNSWTPSADGATWTWDDPNPAGTFAHGRVFIDNLDGTGWHNIDAGYLFYCDNGDDSHWKNFYPPPPTANTALVTQAGEFFCLLGHPGTITTIYASDLGSTPTYAAVGAGEIGTGNVFDLGPDDTGYTTTINGHLYFGFLARGPRAEAHKNGTMPFRVNLCGWHDDSSPGLLIDRAAYVYQDVFTQLHGNNGQGYQAGARLTIPSFLSAPTVPILQSTTFAAVQALTATEMGTTNGALATVYLDSFDVTWRQFMQDMNTTFFWDTGENHHGQLILAMMAAAVDPDDGAIFREWIDIRRVEDAGEPQHDQIENVVRYEFDYHPIEQTYRSGIQTISDTASIAGYGESKSESVRGLRYTRDPATAAYCAQRYLDDRAIAPQYPAIVTKLRKGVPVELGTQFRIEHSDLGPAVVLCYCREHGLSETKGTVRLRGRVRGVVGSP